MFYLPNRGGMWDPSVLWYRGAYYMLCMHGEENGPWDGMWLAKSDDGVHWEDIGRVLTDERGVCKMFVHEVLGQNKLFVNYGSFSNGADNDTLRYCISSDFINWEEIGESNPDSKWYNSSGRWDHMYVMNDSESGKYFGYVVATPKSELSRSWGLLESGDGINFTQCEPPVIEWGDIPPIDMLEGGGCEKIGDTYYYIGGYVGYARSWGYGLYTFTSKDPRGPFKPDTEAFRLCGFSSLPGRVFIQNLACFVRGRDGELLISNAADAGGRYQIWLLPMRAVKIDENNHLRLAYWDGNKAAYGKEIQLSEDDFSVVYSDSEPYNSPGNDWNQCEYKASKTNTGLELHIKTDSTKGPQVVDRHIMAELCTDIDTERGIIFEGKVKASINPVYNETTHGTLCWRPSVFGIALGEGENGEYISQTLEIGYKYKRKSYIEKLKTDNSVKTFKYEIIDTTGENCATVRGIDQNVVYDFKLFYRRNMFELYVGGYLVQMFVHLKPQRNKIAFILRNASAEISDLRMYSMNF